jgi:hypothetical protein
MTDTETKLRHGLREAVRGKVPTHRVDEVVDLAMHAVNRAFAAIGEVTARASDSRVAICATGIALSVVAAEASAKMKVLEREVGGAGMTVTNAHVEIRS